MSQLGKSDVRDLAVSERGTTGDDAEGKYGTVPAGQGGEEGGFPTEEGSRVGTAP